MCKELGFCKENNLRFIHVKIPIRISYVIMRKSIVTTLLYLLPAHPVLGFTTTNPSTIIIALPTRSSRSFALSMVDSNVLMGGGIAVAGLVAGVGLVTFAEGMGERSKARGGGLSEDMAMKITGGLMEDVEVCSLYNKCNLLNNSRFLCDIFLSH